MTASFFAAAAASNGNNTTSQAPVTLPTGVAGMVARLVLTIPSNTATVTVPTGWTQVGSPLVIAQPLTSVMFKRVLAASDDGTTVTVSFSAPSRWAIAVLVEANAVDTQATTTAQTTVAGTAQAIPASAVASGASQEAAIIGYTALSATGATPPAGWTLRAESWTANAINRRQGIQVLTRDATVANGATGATVNTTAADTDTKSQAFAFLFSDAAAPSSNPPVGWVVGAIAMRASA